MRRFPQSAGFTLIEVMIVVAVLGALVLLGGTLMGDSFNEARAKGGARSLADLFTIARTEAIRTGDNHVVFFGFDAQDAPLANPSGGAAAGLVIRDTNANGKIDAGERIATVNVDGTGSLGWGSSFAAASSTQAPDDNPGATFPEADPNFLCCTFLEPGGQPARWVVFLPDGMPRAFSIDPFVLGDLGTGNGGVYVTAGRRDYAAILASLGGIRVHSWPKGGNAWTQ